MLLRQTWADLLFLHWTVPPAAVSPLLPPGLELDLHEGRAYVGLVPFTIPKTRIAFLPPLPGLSSFHEVNVRTYVRRGGHDPGVWFFSLDAANPVMVVGARWLYRLGYRYARMELTREGDRVRFSSKRRWPGPLPAGCSLSYRPHGPVAPAAPDTLEHFLLERYVLYATDGRRIYQGRVRHAPYPAQAAVVEEMQETLIRAAGLPSPEGPPLAHYAREVEVEILPLRRL